MSKPTMKSTYMNKRVRLKFDVTTCDGKKHKAGTVLTVCSLWRGRLVLEDENRKNTIRQLPRSYVELID